LHFLVSVATLNYLSNVQVFLVHNTLINKSMVVFPGFGSLWGLSLLKWVLITWKIKRWKVRNRIKFQNICCKWRQIEIRSCFVTEILRKTLKIMSDPFSFFLGSFPTAIEIQLTTDLQILPLKMHITKFINNN
jgi:hypothetical protein